MADLLGSWSIDPADAAGRASFRGVAMEFRPDGELRYSIVDGEKTEVILLTYRVDGGELVTDQPSHRREERSRFSFTDDGKLCIEFAGERAVFVRAE